MKSTVARIPRGMHNVAFFKSISVTLLIQFSCSTHTVIIWGIPLPGSGIVGKILSAQSKTTVRNINLRIMGEMINEINFPTIAGGFLNNAQ